MKKKWLTGHPYGDSLQKIVRIMRLTILLLLGCMLTVSANSYAQKTKLDINLSNSTIRDLFAFIEDNSEFVFLYRNEDLNVLKKVELNLKDASIYQILDEVLKGENVSYDVYERQIVIRKTSEVFNSQQKKELSGTVHDSNGGSLPGVSIQVKGTTFGTITDVNGEFKLLVPADPKSISVSFVGMKTQEIAVAGRTVFTVVMEENVVGVDEVVIVGYGVQKKINVTGSITTVSSEELEERPVTSVAQALQGVVPNLQINTTDGGRPGTELSWQIRGTGTIGGASGNPLILIDGIPGDPNALNPDDIASVSILKDAAASAVYGSRAPYGVVIINTKRGKAKQMQVTFKSDFSLRSPTQLLKPMTSLEFMNYQNEGAANLGLSPYFPQYYIDSLVYNIEHPGERPPSLRNPTDPTKWGDPVAVDTDWWKAIYQNLAPTQNYNVTASGGSEAIRYYASLGYFDQEGLYKIGSDRYKRYTGRLNLDVAATKWLDLSLRTQLSRKDNNTPYAPEMQRVAYRSWPIYPIKEGNGYWATGAYALQMAEEGGREITVDDASDNTFAFILKPFEGFKLNGDATFNSSNMMFTRNNKVLYNHKVNGDILSTIPNNNASQSFIEKQYTLNKYYSVNLYGEYTKQLGSHYLHLLAGYQQEYNHWFQLYGYRSDLLSEDVPSLNAATGTDIKTNDGEYEWATRGYFGRINYNFKEKYLFEMNVRYDGSSRFPSDYRWGFFPSASAGYVISKEPFFDPLSETINSLKFRASYGQLGNANVSQYYYSPSMSKAQTDYIGPSGTFLDYVTAPGFGRYSLTWEKPTTFNLGMDAELFNNQLQMNFDWYRRVTTDMIGPPQPLPSVLGATQPEENNTELTGTGWEFTLSYKGTVNDFHYGATLNVAHHQEKVTKYYNPKGLFTTYYEGMKLGEIWGFETIGFINDTETLNTMPSQSAISPNWGLGDIQYKDQLTVDTDGNGIPDAGDGKITRGSQTLDDPGDYVKIGNSTPDFSFNIILNADYKGFDMRVIFTGLGPTDWWPGQGGQGAWSDQNRTLYTFFGSSQNRWNHGQYKDHLDHWTPDNHDAYYPRVLIGGNQSNRNMQIQTKYLQNRAYLRLQNIQVGYTFPKQWFQSYFIKDSRIYFSGENLFTWTNLRMFDPETPGIIYPMQKVYSAGIKLTF